MSSRRRLPALLVGVVLCALAWAGSPGAAARTPSNVRASLDWHACADLPEDAPTTFECATVEVPRDYSRPNGRQITLALTRLPAKDAANRIGSLFFNFGGPGGDGVSSLQAISARYDPLNRRFDLVGFDPRGVGQSSPAIDCAVNQETDGIYAQPFPTPDNLDVDALVARDRAYVERCVERNADILPYVSTANVARDMDVLREAVGDSRLTYLGFSYGTTLGATYAAMFPTHFRSMVLDGAFSADQYVNQPLESLREYTAGFERALDRFLHACAAHQDACKGFGGEDPWTALDELVERANAQPLPVTGDNPRPVDGDDILAAANQSMFAKKLWPGLAKALAQAQA
ncbi:MAG TPA: alpha/beta fold hydrolase, partial [Solirubrobacteraceae bacterium]